MAAISSLLWSLFLLVGAVLGVTLTFNAGDAGYLI